MALGGEPNPRGLAALQKILPASPRTAEPGEIANVVLFLATDEANFLNGAAIPVDGGWLATGATRTAHTADFEQYRRQ